ncbi:MAG: hypothetical protein JST83_18430 [Bacteroidetes bacterium]|nr:hypothetical protein [Bacteroidota bacterium]
MNQILCVFTVTHKPPRRGITVKYKVGYLRDAHEGYDALAGDSFDLAIVNSFTDKRVETIVWEIRDTYSTEMNILPLLGRFLPSPIRFTIESEPTETDSTLNDNGAKIHESSEQLITLLQRMDIKTIEAELFKLPKAINIRLSRADYKRLSKSIHQYDPLNPIMLINH